MLMRSKDVIFHENKKSKHKGLLDLFNNQLTAQRFINLGDQLCGLGTPAKMFGSLKGSPKFYFGGHLLGLGMPAEMHGSEKGSLNIFFRAQPSAL